MTLAQLLLLAIIVVVAWLGSKLKRHEGRIEELESKRVKPQAEEPQAEERRAGKE